MSYRRRRTYGRRRHGGGLHDLLGFIVGAGAIVGALAFVAGAPASATERPAVVVAAPTATIETVGPSARPTARPGRATARPARPIETVAPTVDSAFVQCLSDLGIEIDTLDLDTLDPREYDC